MRFGLALGAALVLVTGCGTPADLKDESSTSPSQQATPQYSVVEGRAESDGRPNYYVVVDSVDLSNDGFKQRVKLVLQAIARTKGDPDFVATVYDHQGAADWAWTNLENAPESCELGGPCGNRPPIPEDRDERNRADERSKAEEHDSERHVVAFYSGGYETNGTSWPYQLAWYPWLSDEISDTGDEVKYEGDEDWRPLPDPTTRPSAAPTAEPINGIFGFIKPYGRDETWNITSTCDAASGDCSGEVTSSAGWTAPVRREDFGPWTLERLDALTGWDCGLQSPDPVDGRKADIHYSWGPVGRNGTVSWVAPRNTCMPDAEAYESRFILKQ